jgi:hypothetical protein
LVSSSISKTLTFDTVKLLLHRAKDGDSEENFRSAGVALFVTSSLSHGEQVETLRLTFSLHDVEIEGNNLRALLLALQDFAVKWVRITPERYQRLEAAENTLVSSIRVQEAS